MADLKIWNDARSVEYNQTTGATRTGPGAPDDNPTIGSAVQSDAFTANLIMVQPEAACHVRFGSNPTATTGDLKLTADQIYDFKVTPGEKLSVIAAA